MRLFRFLLGEDVFQFSAGILAQECGRGVGGALDAGFGSGHAVDGGDLDHIADSSHFVQDFALGHEARLNKNPIHGKCGCVCCHGVFSWGGSNLLKVFLRCSFLDGDVAISSLFIEG